MGVQEIPNKSIDHYSVFPEQLTTKRGEIVTGWLCGKYIWTLKDQKEINIGFAALNVFSLW